MTTIWISRDGGAPKAVNLATIPKPVSYPRFTTHPNELPTARAQRWRNTFKELAEKQHEHVIQCAAYSLNRSKSAKDLERDMKDLADHFAAHHDMDLFVAQAFNRLLTITYQLAGSSRTHRITLSTYHKQCDD